MQTSRRKSQKFCNGLDSESTASIAPSSTDVSLSQRTLPSSANYASVASLLGSPSRSDDEVVSDLLDLIGFDHIDLLPVLISRRSEVRAAFETQNSAVSADAYRNQQEN